MEYCAQHAREGMVDVKSKKCRTASCGKVPSFGVAGTKTAEYCAQHAPEGMVNVKNRKCRTEGCGKLPAFGVAGTITGKYCAQHAPEGMVNVKKRKCRIEGCGKLPFFRSCGYENVGILCKAILGRDGASQKLSSDRGMSSSYEGRQGAANGQDSWRWLHQFKASTIMDPGISIFPIYV